MNARLEQLAGHYDAMNTRERITVLGGIILVLGSLWMSMFFDVLAAETEMLASQIDGLKKEVSGHEIIIREYEEINLQDPNIEVEKKKEALLDQINLLNLNVSQEATNLIPPEKMVEVLTEMLKKNTRLQLLVVKNEPPELLMEAKKNMGLGAISDQDEKASNEVGVNSAYGNVYKHALILKLKGSYKGALTYLQKLEELPWNFFWGNLTYKVQQHPHGILTLEIHTLSLNKQWIGVKKIDA